LQAKLPTEKEYRGFEQQVLSTRELPDCIFRCLENLPKEAEPVDVLQATVPLMAVADPELRNESREAKVRKSIGMGEIA
jgi:citrate synthase